MGGFVSCRDQTTQMLLTVGVPTAIVNDVAQNIKTGEEFRGATLQALQFCFGYQKVKDITFRKLEELIVQDFKVTEITLKCLARMAGQQISELFSIYENKVSTLVRLYIYQVALSMDVDELRTVCEQLSKCMSDSPGTNEADIKILLFGKFVGDELKACFDKLQNLYAANSGTKQFAHKLAKYYAKFLAMSQTEENKVLCFQYLYNKLNRLWQIIMSRKQAIGATCIDDGLQKLLIKSSAKVNTNVVVTVAQDTEMSASSEVEP